MKSAIPLRPDTIRELRAALAENNLQKYISGRLEHASRVHSGLPSDKHRLLIKTSNVFRGDGGRHAILRGVNTFRQTQNAPGYDGVGLDNYNDEGDVSVDARVDGHRNAELTGNTTLMKGPGQSKARPIIVTYQPEPAIGRQASAADISRADEAAAWLSLIPQDKWIIRRTVCMATTVDARTGKQKHSFAAIALEIGAEKTAIGPWLHQGIAIIADALKNKLTALGYAVRKPTTKESKMDTSKPINPDTMLTRKETSEAIKHYFDMDISYETLGVYAFKGTGPLMYKPLGKVFYKWSDVCEWIIERSKPRYTTRQLAMA